MTEEEYMEELVNGDTYINEILEKLEERYGKTTPERIQKLRVIIQKYVDSVNGS